MNAPLTRLLFALAAGLSLQAAVAADKTLEEPPIIINLEPVIIEGEPIKDRMTPEEIHKKFREVLGDPNKEVLSEKWLSNDTVVIDTKGSRYCVKFVPPNLRSSLDPAAGFAGICKGF